jgi:copper(I)-binding protein
LADRATPLHPEFEEWTMKRRMMLAGLALAGFPATAMAQSVAVSDAWARATTSTARVGGVFLTMKASGGEDRVVSAASPVAEKIELHETIRDGAVMRMREVPRLMVSADAPTVLKPGSYHIMLIGLKRPLNRGESFPLTISFEKAPAVTVQVTVQAAGASAASGHRGH